MISLQLLRGVTNFLRYARRRVHAGHAGQDEVKWDKASHETDAGWNAKRNARDAAGKVEKEAVKKLREEKKKKQPDQDKIAALQAEITVQQQAAAEADKAMLEIEKDFNNPDIVKYLQTTTLGRDAAREDETSWCSSYVNWCMEQAGYRGTDDAGASSWLNWGEKISEPRYGAITVVTRSAEPLLYHVGFYVGLGKKYIKDGDEAVLDKKGNDTGKRRPKRKAVDAVNLLSGNFSSRIREFADWTVNAARQPGHASGRVPLAHSEGQTMKDMVRRFACSFALAGCLAAPALAAPPCNAPDPAALRSTWQAFRGAALAGEAEQAAQFHKFPLKLLPPMQGPKPMLISRKVFVHNYRALFQRHPDGQEIGLFAAMKAGSGNEAIPKIHFDAQKCALSAPVSVADYDFTYDQKRGWLIEAIEYGGDFDTAKVFDSDKIVN